MSDVKQVGVVLAGCGHLDGSEIREALFTLLSLDQILAEKGNILTMAPDKDQHDVMNHVSSAPHENNSRNVLQEASRLTRGPIARLGEINADELDALILPGGFGAAKNLSDFAVNGPAGVVEPELEKLILGMHEQKKPIGAMCIAPAIVAMVLGSKGVKLTIGNDPDTAAAIETTGASHQECAVEEICFDEGNKVVTTPAYMYGDAPIRNVHTGINKLVEKVVSLF